MEQFTKKLAEYVANTNFDDLPSEVVERAKTIMLDTLSCAVAGHTQAQEECRWITNLAAELGGKGNCTIWLTGEKTSMHIAALANAAMVHTVDFDDTHIDSIAHLGASLLGTVLAVGEQVNANGKDVITAFVLGFEVGARVGNSVNKGAIHYHYKYWHPTATAGTIGCAAAAAKLMNFDARQTEQTIGLGTDQASGFRYCVDKGDFSKSLHTGWAAMRGVMSAQIISIGAGGPFGLLEYPTGFCNAMSEQPNLAELTTGIGKNYEIFRDALKMYPTIHGSHSGIEATLNLIITHNIDYRNIDKILLRLSPLAKNQGTNTNPESILAARLSVPCCLAIAARKRQVTLADFTEDLLTDSENLAFMQKVELKPEPEFNKLYPSSGFTGEVTITLNDGKQYTELIIYPKAHPERPASQKDIEDKYKMLAGITWSQGQVKRVYELMMKLENCMTVRDLPAEFRG